MSYKCAFCDKPEFMPKWFGCPGAVYRPNQYSVCEDHKDLSLTWDDVYSEPDCVTKMTRPFKYILEEVDIEGDQ